MVVVKIKPLSVNLCWQGQRFKTPEYKRYETAVLLMLPKFKLPEPPYRFTLELGMSNIMSDWDNPVKPIQDILQKKYGFNDRHVMEANVKKVKVAKGAEYFSFKLETLLP
jgi:Holliday junction resolvase RusA-like endonuclease